MYICPVCKKEYEQEALVVKCYLKCWKEKYPIYKPNNAPRSEDRVERQCTSEIEDFFRKLG